MGRTVIGSCGLLIAIGLASSPAEAGDRKSSGGDVQESKMEIFGSSHKTRTILVSGRSEQPDASAVRLFEGNDSVLASKRLGGHEEKENLRRAQKGAQISDPVPLRFQARRG